jgi:hypothetical protein
MPKCVKPKLGHPRRLGKAALSDGLIFELSPAVDDGLVAIEVDVGRREVAETFAKRGIW